MTTVGTARALRGTGLGWDPVRGDRFVIPDRDMDADVFVLSDMTIEAHEFPTGRVLGFNGTTEWALDSVEAEQAVWLPSEGQLRALLGEVFVRLERRGGAWAVTTQRASGPHATTDPDAEEAYAVALLAVRAVTARDLLPVAAHDLAERLATLDAQGWAAAAPDGARTVSQVVAGVLGEPAGGWEAALGTLLADWGRAEPAGSAVGPDAVLLELVLATWDVARATVQDDRPDPACVRAALVAARAWGAAELAAPLEGPADEQAQLLALTGRDPR